MYGQVHAFECEGGEWLKSIELNVQQAREEGLSSRHTWRCMLSEAVLPAAPAPPPLLLRCW